MDIAAAMLKILFAMALGFLFNKIKVINSSVCSSMSRLVTMAAAPCLCFSAVLSLSDENKSAVLYLLLAGIGLYIIMPIISFLAAKLLSKNKNDRGVFEAMMTFGNSAFIAFPVGQALMGDIGVSYLSILNVFQSVLAFSLGVFQLTRGNKGAAKFSFKKLINPAIIGALVAVVLYLIGVKLPQLVMQPISFVGQICSPLSMVIIGSSIADQPLKELFTNWRYYIVALFKLIIIPAVIFVPVFMIFGPSEITSAILIHCLMPTAAIITLVAIQYGADSKTTSQGTGLMDLLCLGTIPLMWIISRLFY